MSNIVSLLIIIIIIQRLILNFKVRNCLGVIIYQMHIKQHFEFYYYYYY